MSSNVGCNIGSPPHAPDQSRHACQYGAKGWETCAVLQGTLGAAVLGALTPVSDCIMSWLMSALGAALGASVKSLKSSAGVGAGRAAGAAEAAAGLAAGVGRPPNGCSSVAAAAVAAPAGLDAGAVDDSNVPKSSSSSLGLFMAGTCGRGASAGAGAGDGRPALGAALGASLGPNRCSMGLCRGRTSKSAALKCACACRGKRFPQPKRREFLSL